MPQQTKSRGLYGVDVTLDNLLNIDKGTGAATVIALVGSPVVAGLACDPESGILYGTDTLTMNLVTIDPCSGTTTIIGNTGIYLPHGLALDPSDGTLYATDAVSNLYIIDKSTAVVNLVGPVGYPHIGALDFDPTTGSLHGAYAHSSTTGYLIKIDTTTGEGTFVANTHRINGLCFDEDGTLYASENGLYPHVDSSLYIVNKLTGEWSVLGSIGVDNVLGIDQPMILDLVIEVAVDIKPGSCPNPVNVKQTGVVPVAILGTEDFDVNEIDVASVRLEGVAPIRSSFEDVATPVSDSNDCNCITDGPDGYFDLTLKFETQRIVEAIGDVNDGDVVALMLTGVLFDPMPFETPIEGADCILIRGRHKPISPADINKDGVVNAADFAIFAQNWLQSSIVDE
ncbi:MAG: NHL repeat-containing protein [Planctomycetota bacterium]